MSAHNAGHAAFDALYAEVRPAVEIVARRTHRRFPAVSRLALLAAIEQRLYERLSDVAKARAQGKSVIGYVRTLARNAALKRVREES